MTGTITPHSQLRQFILKSPVLASLVRRPLNSLVQLHESVKGLWVYTPSTLRQVGTSYIGPSAAFIVVWQGDWRGTVNKCKLYIEIDQHKEYFRARACDPTHLVVHQRSSQTLTISHRMPREVIIQPPLWIKADCTSSVIGVLVWCSHGLVRWEIDAETV
jgi:hypothetical protein